MYNFLSIINLVLAIATVIDGIMAYRHGFTRTANEVQERVIQALNSEPQALRRRIESMEKENIRLHQIIATICSALKQRGIAVTIDGDMVNISDQQGTHSQRIHEHEHGARRWRRSALIAKFSWMGLATLCSQAPTP